MKPFLLLIGFLGIISAILVPYWTGIEAQQQFEQFNQTLSPLINLKWSDRHYNRGWFSSNAQSMFEITNASKPAAADQRFMVVHKIHHGFLPLRATHIETILYTKSTHSKNLTVPELTTEDRELLTAQTVVNLTGDTLTTLITSPLSWRDENSYFQVDWQGWQGEIQFKPSEMMINADLHSPQISLDTMPGKIDIQSLGFTLQLPPGSTTVREGRGNLTMAQIQLLPHHQSYQSPISLAGVTITAQNQVASDHLTVALATTVQQIQVGKTLYGPGHCEIELRHLQLESLVGIIKALAEGWHSEWSPEQFKLMMLGIFFQHGLTLLNNSPEFAVTRLNFDSPEGRLEGTLQVKMAEEIGLSVLFNPWSVLDTLSGRLEMRLPTTMLHHLVAILLDSSTTTKKTIPNSVQQRIQTWLDQGILINYGNHDYSILLQIQQGELQFHGKTLPLSSLWQ